MKMTNLKPLYDDMRVNNQMVINFPFNYNSKAYTCLFEIISRPFKLQIATVGKNPVLFEFDVLPGFFIKPYLELEEFHRLVRILGIRYDPNHIFKLNDFLRVLNKRIPQNCGEAKKLQNAAIRKRKKMFKNTDKEIFIGWYTNPPGNHVSDYNYLTTKEHFGSVYADYLKSINTSTRWSTRIVNATDKKH